MIEVPIANAQPQHASEKRSPKSVVTEFIKFIFFAAIIVLPIRMFIAQPFVVSGSSMVPTFEDGEYLIVDEISYRFINPVRGEVVIFQYPKDPSKFFIKRIIGLPGETISIRDGNIVVTSDEYPDGLVVPEPYLTEFSHESHLVTLDDEEYFVMGDNRPASSDSRIWGPLDRDFIIGKAFVRLLPFNRAELFPGQEITFE